MMPALGAALLCSIRAGSDLGRKSDWLRSYIVLRIVLAHKHIFVELGGGVDDALI